MRTLSALIAAMALGATAAHAAALTAEQQREIYASVGEWLAKTGAPSVSIAVASGLRTEDSCKEFGSAFLNSACLTRHKKFAVRRIHRVATFVIGRSDAQQ